LLKERTVGTTIVEDALTDEAEEEGTLLARIADV
jgi:hypothetical protein